MPDNETAMRNDLDDLAAAVSGTSTKRIVVILCGTQSDGTITPVRVDSDGKLVTTT
jgi:hypothetical protein